MVNTEGRKKIKRPEGKRQGKDDGVLYRGGKPFFLDSLTGLTTKST